MSSDTTINGGSVFGDDYDSIKVRCPLHGAWTTFDVCPRCRIATLERRLHIATEALTRIHEGIPACDGCGGLYIAHFDGEGNEIGIENVDPMSVIQSMDGCACDALATIAKMKGANE